jgi:hypothetical protein
LRPEFAFPTRLLSVGNANSGLKHPQDNNWKNNFKTCAVRCT